MLVLLFFCMFEPTYCSVGACVCVFFDYSCVCDCVRSSDCLGGCVCVFLVHVSVFVGS